MEGATAATGTVTVPNAYLQSDVFPLTGGLTYDLQFFAANPVKVGGANPQYRLSYYDANHVFISDSGFISFASAGGTFSAFNLTNTAPGERRLCADPIHPGRRWRQWFRLGDPAR